MAALLHSLPTQGIMGTLIIPFYSLSSQPIYWDKTKQEREIITLFHPHPCLINVSALYKQANGSVGGSTEHKTNIDLWRHVVKTPCSHRSQLSFIFFYQQLGVWCMLLQVLVSKTKQFSAFKGIFRFFFFFFWSGVVVTEVKQCASVDDTNLDIFINQFYSWMNEKKHIRPCFHHVSLPINTSERNQPVI